MKHPTQLNEEKLVCGGGGVAWMNVLIRATRDHLHQTSLFFFSFLPAVLTTWNGKTATWFTHEYIKNDSILSVYISICILKTPCIKSFSGPHTGITADNLHHAANIHTTTGWRLDSGKKNKLIKKRNHNIGFGSVYSILFRKILLRPTDLIIF